MCLFWDVSPKQKKSSKKSKKSKGKRRSTPAADEAMSPVLPKQSQSISRDEVENRPQAQQDQPTQTQTPSAGSLDQMRLMALIEAGIKEMRESCKTAIDKGEEAKQLADTLRQRADAAEQKCREEELVREQQRREQARFDEGVRVGAEKAREQESQQSMRAKVLEWQWADTEELRQRRERDSDGTRQSPTRPEAPPRQPARNPGYGRRRHQNRDRAPNDEPPHSTTSTPVHSCNSTSCSNSCSISHGQHGQYTACHHSRGDSRWSGYGGPVATPPVVCQGLPMAWNAPTVVYPYYLPQQPYPATPYHTHTSLHPGWPHY